MERYQGRCLCGQITYVVDGAPVIVAQCHCDECRRLSGTGHTVGAMFATSDVSVHGTLNTYQYTSALGSTVTKATCAICASPIYGTNTRSPNHMTIPLGSFDDARDLTVQVVIFERDRPHWDTLGDKVTRFATQPDWAPDK